MLSEISQTEKYKYLMLSFICEIKKKKKNLIEKKTIVLWELILIETGSRMVAATD